MRDKILQSQKEDRLDIIPNLRVVDWWWRGDRLFTATAMLCCAAIAYLPRPN